MVFQILCRRQSVSQKLRMDRKKADLKITRGKKSKWNGMRAGAAPPSLSKAQKRIPQTLTVCHAAPMALFALRLSSPRLWTRVGKAKNNVSIVSLIVLGPWHERRQWGSMNLLHMATHGKNIGFMRTTFYKSVGPSPHNPAVPCIIASGVQAL